MKYKRLRGGLHWEIGTLVPMEAGDDDDSELELWLESLEREHPKAYAQLDRMLDRITQSAKHEGPKMLTSQQCHEASKSEKIFQLSTGRKQARVCFFLDDGRVVICTHGFRKKERKTPTSEVTKAVRYRERYLGQRR